MRAGLGREFRAKGELERSFGEKYRAERGSLAELLAARPDTAHPVAAGLGVLQRRGEALRPLCEELRALERSGALNRPVEDLAHRYSHLHVNRMLRTMLREQELRIMDFLARAYRSQAARR